MKRIIKLFNEGNVMVTGLRGRGKDLLFGNVIARRKQPYASNLDYTNGKYYIPYNYNDIALNGNTYDDFINGTVKKYVFPYPPSTDIYISDGGVYFPSQYCSDLNRKYPQMPLFQALSRQVGTDSNFHCNVQNLNRLWDKLRESSDIYLRCEWCFYIPFKKVLPFARDLVIQRVTYYDKYDSCLNRMKKFSVRTPIFATPQTKTSVDLQRQTYECTHGVIKPMLLIYFNQSCHDTYYFREVLKNGI